ncbi:MAG: hypothetical protein ACYC7E_05615 [Armatimonadota bacterium]
MSRRYFFSSLLLLIGLCVGLAQAAGLPDAKTGGAGGKPIALLYLSESPQIDPAYAQQLTREGFTFTSASYFTPLSPAFLKKFNVFIFDRLPIAGEENNIFGQRMLHYWDNMKALWECARNGAGVLVYTNLADCGGALALGWNGEMKRWGIQAEQTTVLDPSLAFLKWVAYGENSYVWTENIAAHAATEGVKRVYYAAANTRWDDCYTAPPLICNSEWTPLVKAMPGARTGTLVDHTWVYEPDGPGAPVLAAVRQLGKGRMAVVSICPSYIHRLGYTKLASNNYGEMSYGPIDGIILQKGNGVVPSDTGKLVSNLYAWLAGASGAAGIGGYATGSPLETVATPQTEEEKNFNPVLDPDTMTMPAAWRHRPTSISFKGEQYYPEFRDPLVTGDLRFFKALVGAHSDFSDGAGSVEDYAVAAKAAGYSLLVFTENFERLSRADWTKLVAACAKNSGDDFVCLPAMDIMDPEGNHFLIVAPPYYPRAGWLSPDGKRLVKTQMINLLYGNHIVVAHRPESGPLPQERLKHFQGLTVFTYRNGNVVDDSLHAYAWQVMNGSNPHPIVVHEIFTPAEVAREAKVGFQQLMPADTVKAAVAYFRVGTGHYFECPVRCLISEGPVVTNWVINPKDFGPAKEGRMQFRVDIGVQSDAPLKTVTLYDGFTIIRRWLPNAREFQARADFQHDRQYDMFLVAEDTKGRRVITSSMRTVCGLYHNRCADRQNWLGNIGACYTGLELPSMLNIMMPIKGTAEGSAIFTTVPGTSMAGKLNFPFTCNDVVLTESILDEKYVWALRSDVGADAMPSLPSKPSSVYEGRLRHFAVAPRTKTPVFPTLIEIDLTLKRDVEPVNPASLFPAFGGLRAKKYAWYDKDGKLVSGDIDAKSTLDIPVGGYAGGYLALSEGLRIENGRFGLAAPKGTPATLPLGTRLRARFIIAATAMPWSSSKGDMMDSDPAGWLRALGVAGKLPYSVSLARGSMIIGDFPLAMTAVKYGVSGEVRATADLPVQAPLRISGVNTRWPAGIWRADGTLVYGGTFEGALWTHLDAGVKGKFYAGNLITADHPDLVLEIIKWEAGNIKVGVHNPTATSIDAVVSTPKEIVGRKALSRKVTVPAGATVYLEE